MSQTARLLTILEKTQTALGQSLQAQLKLSQQLAQLAAEQSQQITTVLQAQFVRPVLSQTDRTNQTHDVAIAEPLNDVATFPEATDAQNATADNQALESATSALEAQLDAGFKEILAEHQAAHPEFLLEEVPA